MLVGLIESDQWARRHQAQGGGKSYQEFLDGMAKGYLDAAFSYPRNGRGCGQNCTPSLRWLFCAG